MFKKFFSYFFPINIYKSNSPISKSLEVTWTNGELLMDSENTNYSYGCLQRFLRIGLLKIGFNKILTFDRILVLGVAGGSVIRTLVDEIEFKGKITGVEIDPKVIEIANTFFQLNEIPNLEIHIQNAFDFVLKCNEKYDLIIIDVFEDLVMPNFLFEGYFFNHVTTLLNKKGFVLFNTLIVSESDNNRNLKFLKNFKKSNFKINSLPRIEKNNELILIQKLN